jgi:hypothetical protein
MNKKEANKHIKVCERLYAKTGTSAVYDYANKHNINEWVYCKPCDAETPRVNGICLVCGQHHGKVAKLIAISLMTRVIVDQDATDEQIIETARPKLLTLVDEPLGDKVEEIYDDEECPYGELEKDK